MPGTSSAESLTKRKLRLLEGLSRATQLTVPELAALTQVFEALARQTTPSPALRADTPAFPVGGNGGQNHGTSLMAMEQRSAALKSQKTTQVPETTLDLPTFRDFIHNTFEIYGSEPLLDRIFRTFSRKGCDHRLNLEDFLGGMRIFLRGSFQDKMQFCFAAYDLNGDGFITKDEMMHFLKDSLTKCAGGDDDPKEGIRDLIDIVMRKIDRDGDGKISFDDYYFSVQADPLLLEFLGQCLPEEKAKDAFRATFADNFIHHELSMRLNGSGAINDGNPVIKFDF